MSRATSRPGRSRRTATGAWLLTFLLALGCLGGEDDVWSCIYGPRPPGELVWAARAGGLLADDAYGVSALSDNSTVVTGQFRDVVTFGRNEPNETTLVSAGKEDAFVARFWRDGRLVWAKRAGGGDLCLGEGIAALADHSVVVTGSFKDSATFGPGESDETTLVSAGGADVFIARYTQSGSLLWVRQAGGAGDDLGKGVAVLSNGSVAITGQFAGTATFGPGETNETVLTSSGPVEAFVARCGPDGSLAWARQLGGDWGTGVAALSAGSAVVAGSFSGTPTFGAGEPNATMLISAGEIDVFVARYDADGRLVWAKSGGGDAIDEGRRVVALSDDSAVVLGDFQGTATFSAGDPSSMSLTSAGNSDIFMVRYEADGSLAWAGRAGGADFESGQGATVLADDSVVATGTFRGTATFGQGWPGETLLTSTGNRDVFVARYARDGTLVWAKRAGGTGAAYGVSATTLFDDSVVVAGGFSGSFTLGPGEGNETGLTSAGDSDVFLARFYP
jgi:hypothetical protein